MYLSVCVCYLASCCFIVICFFEGGLEGMNEVRERIGGAQQQQPPNEVFKVNRPSLLDTPESLVKRVVSLAFGTITKKLEGKRDRGSVLLK